jgi:hypothetical protein
LSNGLNKSWLIISENKKLIQAMTAFNTNQISSPPTENQLIAIPVVN